MGILYFQIIIIKLNRDILINLINHVCSIHKNLNNSSNLENIFYFKKLIVSIFCFIVPYRIWTKRKRLTDHKLSQSCDHTHSQPNWQSCLSKYRLKVSPSGESSIDVD